MAAPNAPKHIQPMFECQLHRASYIFHAATWLWARKIKHRAEFLHFFFTFRGHSFQPQKDTQHTSADQQLIQHNTDLKQDYIPAVFSSFIFVTVVFRHRQREGKPGRLMTLSRHQGNSLKGNGLWKRWWTIKKWFNSHLGHRCRSFFPPAGVVGPQSGGSATTRLQMQKLR